MIHQPDSISTQGVFEHRAAETHWVLYPFPCCNLHAIICMCIKSQLGYTFFLFQSYFSLGACDHKVFISSMFFPLGIFKMCILFKGISELLFNPSPLLHSTHLHKDASEVPPHFFTLNPSPIAPDLHLRPEWAWWVYAPLSFGPLAWPIGSTCSKNSC